MRVGKAQQKLRSILSSVQKLIEVRLLPVGPSIGAAKARARLSARHAAAKAAFDALQMLLGEPSAVASEEP